MTIEKLYNRILKACERIGRDAGIASLISLEPLSGSKIMPPTYAEVIYHQEPRFIDGKLKDIVILDSIQSSANRMELAALDAINNNLMQMPLISTYIKTFDRDYSVLELSHRLFDATLRDSDHAVTGHPFPSIPEIMPIYSQKRTEALPAILRCNPVGLILGCWNSTSGVSMEKALRLPRAITSEVWGVLESRTRKSGSRIDPLQIGQQSIYMKKENNKLTWSFDKPADKLYKEESPAEINHGNIPPALNNESKGKGGGVTVSQIVHGTSFSIQALYGNYSTGNVNDKYVRAMLLSLGLCMHALRSEAYFLRSGCALMRKQEANEYLWRSVGSQDKFTLSPEEGLALYQHSVDVVLKNKVAYDPKYRLKLKANKDLEAIVFNSFVGKAKTDKKNKQKDEAAVNNQ